MLSRKNNPDLPIIIVVGIHRTGSTLISQVLSNHFPVAPLGNFFTLLSRSRYLAQHLGKYLYTQKRRDNIRYRNFYGISPGLFAMGDAYPVWDQWFGNDHYNKPQMVKQKKLDAMKNYFGWMHAIWKRPILVKNNRNSLLVKELKESFPNALFVAVEREPAPTIRSTMKASKDFFGNDEIMWGLKPSRNFDTSQHKTILDAYCHQFLELEQLINEQLSSLNDDQVLRVQYEEFCNDPTSFLDSAEALLSTKFGISRDLAIEPPASFSPRSNVANTKETQAISERIVEIKSKGSKPS